MEGAELVPLLIAGGGGGNAYLEDPESIQNQIQLEQYENSTKAPSSDGETGAAGTGLYYSSYSTSADVQEQFWAVCIVVTCMHTYGVCHRNRRSEFL